MLSSGSANQGGTVSLNLNFTPSGNQPAGLEWAFVYSPSDIVSLSVAPGAAAAAAGKSISCAGSGGSYMCLATGINTNTIASGVVAVLTVTLAPNTTSTTIGVANTLGATLGGDSYTTSGASGTVTVASSTTYHMLSLSCTPASLQGSGSSTCTVTLDTAAPAAGVAISLSGNNSNLTVPPSVTVPAGSTTGTFAATSPGVTTDQNATVTATYNGISLSSTVILAAPAVLSSLQCSPTALGSNASGNCTVTLSKAAGVGGAVVSLSSTGLAGLTVPASVTVAANATTASFTISMGTIAGLSASQSGSVTATYGGTSQSVNITLAAATVVSSLQCNSNSVSTSVTGASVWSSSAVPGNPWLGDLSPVTVGVKFRSDTSGSISGIRFYKGAGNNGTHIGLLYSSTGTLLAQATFTGETSSGWQQVTFSSPVSISANTTYIAAYFTNSGYADDRQFFTSTGVDNAPLHELRSGVDGSNGVYMYSDTPKFPSQTYADSNYWVDVVFSAGSSPPPSVWTSSAVPGTPWLGDLSPVTLGMKFRSDISRSVSGIRFYKGAGNNGTHIGLLYSSTGALLAQATFTGETSSGWQQVSFSTPVSISANTTYIASYFTSSGYADDRQFFTSTGVDNASLHALRSGVDGPNGVYMYGGSPQFPSQTYADSNYWVDVVFSDGAATLTPTMGPNASGNCTVTLSQAAGSGGAVVSLSSTGLAGLTVPASVTVAANATAGSFTVSTGSLSANQSGSVTASYGGASQSVNISLVAAVTAPPVVSSLQCSPTTLGANASGNCTVTLSQAAGSNGAVVSLSSTGLPGLTVPASVTVAANATAGSFTVSTGSLSANQSGSVTASYGGASQSVNISLVAAVAAPVVSSLQCSPTTLGANASGSCTVTLSQAAGSGGAVVSLSSTGLAGLTVPGSVTVAASATTGSFPISTGAVSADQNGSVTASYGGASQSVNISLSAATVVSSLQCSPTTLGANASGNCTVTLSKAAGSGGATVSLSSTGLPGLTVPASVTVAASATTGSFPISTGNLSTTQTGTVTASYGGASQSVNISLAAATVISSLQCNPTTLGANASGSCTVTLSQAAASGGAAVSLSSAGLTGLTVPASVMVAASATTGSFPISTGSVSADQSGTVTASYGGVSQSVNISLAAATVVSSLRCSPTTLGANASGSCTVTLSKAAGSGGVVVSLSSTGLSGLTVPGSVTVAASAMTGSFPISTGSLSANQTGSVTASYGGTSQSMNLSLSAVIVISSLQCNPTTLTSNISSTCTITLSGSAPAGGAFVALSSTLPSVAVPRVASVAAGSTSGIFIIKTFTIAANTTGSLTASYNGSSQSVSLTLSTSTSVSSLQLFCESSSLSSGDSTECTVQLPQRAPTGGATVTLTADNRRLRVPDSIVIEEGNMSAKFPVHSGISDRDEKGTIQASLTGTAQGTSLLLRGIKPASLTCAPRLIRAGQRARCELQLNSVPATEAVNVAVFSSSKHLKVPSTVTTRRGQSSLSFEVFADPAAEPKARIEARYGANVVMEDLLVSSQDAPVLQLPRRQLAKFGETLRFAVTASDSGGPVSPMVSDAPAGALWDVSTGRFVWTPAEFQTGTHEVTFTATNSANISTTERVRIEVGSGKPVINALVNAATGSENVVCSPGAVASVHGKWLSIGARLADPSGNSVDLDGTRVKVNGAPTPVLYADATRVDFLCPQLTAGTALETVVETEAGTSGVAKTIMQQLSPGIFSLDGSGRGQGLVSFRGTSAVAVLRDVRNAGQPAQSGDYLSIRATGLGSLDELSVLKPLVRVGGIPVPADGVDAVAGFAGVFDIRVKLPAGVPTGSDVPVTLELGQDGVASNTVSIAIEPVRP